MLLMDRATFIRVIVGLALTASGSLGAQSLPKAQGRVVLTVSGKIGNPNQGTQAQLDMAMLEALPQRSFTTMTPWQKEPIQFTGPLLRDVLGLIKASGSRILATALNDYQIQIPVEDTQRFDVLMALRMNGEPMPVRTRGPLFIVYPFDALPELRSVRYYERSIWQLRALEIE